MLKRANERTDYLMEVFTVAHVHPLHGIAEALAPLIKKDEEESLEKKAGKGGRGERATGALTG